ncbi:hypothetical protein CAEBREN_22235 [Caenorhabditis brenneri]|uniref:Uncharacterized protein n=1 Tax=Caenorhabditis brenneri TaxID=135651 RepID=G0MNI6_CAEBE|nr:hypothetical protein CAEBREN_22235 [Caenorhabditis brenneri]
MSLTQELCDKVFNNRIILEEILQNTEEEYLFLKYRLVNKKFNDAYLTVLRKRHRRMEITFSVGTETRVTGFYNKFLHINSRKARMSEVPHFFRFLNETCKLHVKEIVIKNVWKLEWEQAKEFHADVLFILIGKNDKHLTTLIGLEAVCDGCWVCVNLLKLSKTLQEYGPMGLKAMGRVKSSCYFKKLHITDRTLEQIANYCVADSEEFNFTKEQFDQNLSSYINPDISCDTLVLCINEIRLVDYRRELCPLPREIVEMMFRKWKVKSIVIRFIFDFSIYHCDDEWTEHVFFTPIPLTGPYDSTPKSNFQFSQVVIDLLESNYCLRDFIEEEPKNASNEHNNLLSNIIRLFPTKSIPIRKVHLSNFVGISIEKVFQNLQRITQIEKHRNLTISVELLLNFRDWMMPIGYSKEETIESIKIPEGFTVQGPQLVLIHRDLVDRPINDFEPLPWIKLTGKRLTKMDNDRNFVLNLDTFVNVDARREITNTESLHPKAFLRHLTLFPCSMASVVF